MILDIEQLAKPHTDKLSKIKGVIFDVDGILTDGRVEWQGEEVGFNRSFNVRDGYGLKLLKSLGLYVGIISGGNSKGLVERLNQLGVADQYLGNEDKRDAYIDFKNKYKLDDSQILYMGDELFDIPILKKCGFSATVEVASKEVRDVCDYVAKMPAGHGCAREVIDMLRFVQNLNPEIPELE